MPWADCQRITGLNPTWTTCGVVHRNGLVGVAEDKSPCVSVYVEQQKMILLPLIQLL